VDVYQALRLHLTSQDPQVHLDLGMVVVALLQVPFHHPRIQEASEEVPIYLEEDEPKEDCILGQLDQEVGSKSDEKDEDRTRNFPSLDLHLQ